MKLEISRPQGEIPILDEKSLPDNAAAKAVNCDFRSATLKPLFAYNLDASLSSEPKKIFFVANVSWDKVVALIGDETFYLVNAPVINTERSIFLFAGNGHTGPKKARLSDINQSSPLATGIVKYCDTIDNVKDLGVEQPEKLIIERVASYTDYLSDKIYYKNDIVHIEDAGDSGDYTDYYLFLCIAESSVGPASDTWNDDITKSNFTIIPRFHEIPIDYGSDGFANHDKQWIFDESGGGQDKWVKNTGDTVVSKEDHIHYTDGYVYWAKFNYINRNRPDDPDAWQHIIDLSDYLEGLATGHDYQIHIYDPDRVYTAGEMVLREFGTYNGDPCYFYYVCNINGTEGVDPQGQMPNQKRRWAIMCCWHPSDAFPYPTTTDFDSDDGVLLTRDIYNSDGTRAASNAKTLVPYWSTYSTKWKDYYALYKYVNADGDVRWGIFSPKRNSSNIRPFNPEWGGENPWMLFRTADEVAINRSQVFDTVAYTWTYVTAWGEESKPAPPTEVKDAHVAEYNRLKTPVDSFPDSHITGFRIYRLSDGSRSAEFFLFRNDDFDSSDLDTWIKDANDMESTIKRDGDLIQEAIATEDWDEPDTNLSGFVSLANGVTAGFVDNEVHFTEPWHYYAWPQKYRMSTHTDIVGLGAFGNTVVCCTKTNPEVITCPLPGQATQRVSPHAQPCVSARSIVSAENFVAYAGHDGLVKVDQSANAVTHTRGIIRQLDWNQTFQSDKVIGAYHEGMYWGAIDGTTDGFIINLSQVEHVVWFNVSSAGLTSISGITVDPYYNYLFIYGPNGSSSYSVLMLPGESDLFSYEWTSKKFRLNQYVCFTTAQIDGDQTEGNAVNIKINADGSEIVDKDITDSDPFRLPAGKYRTLEFTLSGTAEVYFVKFASSPSEL